jgi:hypothetical protein
VVDDKIVHGTSDSSDAEDTRWDGEQLTGEPAQAPAEQQQGLVVRLVPTSKPQILEGLAFPLHLPTVV